MRLNSLVLLTWTDRTEIDLDGLCSSDSASHVSWYWVFCMTVIWKLRGKAVFQQGYNRNSCKN